MVEDYRFLGIVFDRHLTWKAYVCGLRDSCLYAMEVIRTIAHTLNPFLPVIPICRLLPWFCLRSQPEEFFGGDIYRYASTLRSSAFAVELRSSFLDRV